MNIAKRFMFYGFGFAIGMVLLLFFLGGKKTSCAYGPEARTLKNIRIKERKFSEETILALGQHNLDTAVVSKLLKNGAVLFSESNTALEDCKQYIIEGRTKEKDVRLRIENCECIATVLSAQVN